MVGWILGDAPLPLVRFSLPRVERHAGGTDGGEGREKKRSVRVVLFDEGCFFPGLLCFSFAGAFCRSYPFACIPKLVERWRRRSSTE